MCVSGGISRIIAACLLIAFLAGCASSAHYPVNAPLPAPPPAAAYRFSEIPPGDNSESLAVLLTLSGGGARAAALGFGVLEELRHQEITWEGTRKRLLDEVDMIYAVSGGSIVAAYYALYGERTFDDFEKRFLLRDNQTEIASRVLSNLNRLSSPRFGRAEVLAEYLDETLFDGARYQQLIAHQHRPQVVLAATDMTLGARFEFTQDQFDLICSDLAEFSIARAVAASMAVPFVFGPITLQNNADACAAGRTPPTESPRQARRQQQRARELATYLDTENRPYIHLLDGGLSDNLGLRGPLESLQVQAAQARGGRGSGMKGVRRAVFIVVNAESRPDLTPDRSGDVPTLAQQLKAVSDIPLNRYSFETRELLRSSLEQWRAELTPVGRGSRSPDIDFYLIEVDLLNVDSSADREYFLSIPTSLSLTADQVERLRSAGAQLLQKSPEYRRLLRELH
jgi:NTE family protein